MGTLACAFCFECGIQLKLFMNCKEAMLCLNTIGAGAVFEAAVISVLSL